MVNPFYRQTHNIFKIFKISTSTQISKDGGFVLLEYFYSSGGKNSKKLVCISGGIKFLTFFNEI